MPHREIAAWLHDQQGVRPWWSQTVTVGYEQARGLRQKHERPEGYSVSRSATLPVPVEVVFNAWRDGRRRSRWLDETGIVVRRATPSKSMRITWVTAARTST
jgi:hypothetical protein